MQCYIVEVEEVYDEVKDQIQQIVNLGEIGKPLRDYIDMHTVKQTLQPLHALKRMWHCIREC